MHKPRKAGQIFGKPADKSLAYLLKLLVDHNGHLVVSKSTDQGVIVYVRDNGIEVRTAVSAAMSIKIRAALDCHLEFEGYTISRYGNPAKI